MNRITPDRALPRVVRANGIASQPALGS